MSKRNRHFLSGGGIIQKLRSTALGLALAGLTSGPSALAQDPCPETSVLVGGLLAPSKVIQTPLGNFLVSESDWGA